MSVVQALASLRRAWGCLKERSSRYCSSRTLISCSKLTSSPFGNSNHATSLNSNFWASTSTKPLGRKNVVRKEIRSGFSVAASQKRSTVCGRVCKCQNAALSLKVAPTKLARSLKVALEKFALSLKLALEKPTTSLKVAPEKYAPLLKVASEKSATSLKSTSLKSPKPLGKYTPTKLKSLRSSLLCRAFLKSSFLLSLGR